ncbi:dipicolinate synthase subunit DpsA [Acetohalobium arabaticum]|uniref:Shikimate/quinate 5-dehydrogenase n=1 Tax=Acetohalobium arabaticum (strain ATCC 49924 / DSM 5501 / Z-7288) TaxID=574087 RepID=D9QRE4_ACEAZ|nr:dipicolinate synthase subunit DpsA [Acetohalobium arabaticum]ADL13085.1 Shikimate/quinate 5-dehydrogenase [Acetohalobium arabaticum DSM 5501]
MDNKLTGVEIAVLGGGTREEVMLESLIAVDAKVKTLGRPESEIEGLIVEDKVLEVVKDANVVIAPMTGTNEEGYLKATFGDRAVELTQDFFTQLAPESIFMIGIADEEMKDYCQQNNLELIQLAKLDELAILNSIPTAEGAIQVAMEKSDITLHSNKSIVLGLGRVGLTQARMLKGLGSKTYGAARNPADRARAKELGIIPVKFSDLKEVISEMDFIFNTVPAVVLDKEVLSEVKSEVLIIDLASEPGGTDFATAEELGIEAVLSLGLPGRVAPKTAGEILGRITPRLIAERI